MRERLTARVGRRHTYRAVFQRFGSRWFENGVDSTALLTDVVDADTGLPVAAHVWLDEVAPLRAAFPRLDRGDMIEFTATVQMYRGAMGPDAELTDLQDVGWARRRVPRRREEVAS